MTPNIPDHPSLKDYHLINFNGIALYEKELKNLNKEGGPKKSLEKVGFDWKNKLEWRNENDQLHRENGPALIKESGSCIWMTNGIWGRTDSPSTINIKDKHLIWGWNWKQHRIGGFASFCAKNNHYNLMIEDEEFEDPKDYVKAANIWLKQQCLKIFSAHDSLEKFRELDEALELGYLDKKNWKDGLFMGKSS